MKKFISVFISLTLVLSFFSANSVLAATTSSQEVIFKVEKVYYDNSKGCVNIDGYFDNATSQTVKVDYVDITIRAQINGLGWTNLHANVDEKVNPKDPLFTRRIAPKQKLSWTIYIEKDIPLDIVQWYSNSVVNYVAATAQTTQKTVCKTYTVTTNTYLYKTASTSKRLLKLKRGAKVIYISASNIYYKVSTVYNKKTYTGYVLKKYLK